MLNVLWLVLLLGGLGWGCATGDCAGATRTLFDEAGAALRLAIELAALIAFWFGVSRLAEASGLLEAVGSAFRALIRPLFPRVPRGHEVLGLVTMNMAANLMGLANAATPFGLRAMQAFKSLGKGAGDEATPDMVTFLVLNSATVNLIPAGMIALRAAAGSQDPAAPYLASVLATSTAFVATMGVHLILAVRRGMFP